MTPDLTQMAIVSLLTSVSPSLKWGDSYLQPVVFSCTSGRLPGFDCTSLLP